jgi:Protein of unknown function (DUF3185)
MKIISLALLVSGMLLTLHGVSAMGALGHDILQFFSSIAGAKQILPLAAGIVMVVVSIAAMMPDSADAVRTSGDTGDDKGMKTD